MRNVSRQRHDVRHRQLRRRHRVAPGGVDHPDSLGDCRGDVDIAHPFFFVFRSWHVWWRHRAMRDDVNDLGSNIKITLAAEI